MKRLAFAVPLAVAVVVGMPAPAGNVTATSTSEAAGGSCRAPARPPGQWAGWVGDAACAKTAQLWSSPPAADRDCVRDADCELLEAHTCFYVAVSKVAADRYRLSTPCPHPAGGVCPNRSMTAICRDGCCTLREARGRPR